MLSSSYCGVCAGVSPTQKWGTRPAETREKASLRRRDSPPRQCLIWEESGRSAFEQADGVSGRRLTLRPFSKRIEFREWVRDLPGIRYLAPTPGKLPLYSGIFVKTKTRDVFFV